MRARKLTAALAAVPLILASAVGVAYADVINDDAGDTLAAVDALSLEAGSPTGVTGRIKLVASGGDNDPQCNIDAGESALVLDLVTPAGITANPDPLSITSCGDDTPVVFTADETATSGVVTASIVSGPAGGGTYNNTVKIAINVTQPAPANTAPEVSVTGVTHGADYRVSDTPRPGCSVVDAEDSDESAEPEISGGVYNAIGSHTVTCSYTDKGSPALTDTATVTYTVIRDLDRTPPEINNVISGDQGSNRWYVGDVSLDWTVTEVESPMTLKVEGCEDITISADQVATEYSCAASSEGGAATTQTVTIGRDTVAPEVDLVGGPDDQASYYFGSVPAAPTCEASDATSDLDGKCTVSGYSTAVGTHTVTASARDNAGHTASVPRTYTVLAWTTKGFYAPVDMGGLVNTVKGGSTVPLKFELFAGPTELTSTSDVTSFKTTKVACSGLAAQEDAIEVTSTGGTSLRYDETAGQFIQNWQTPKAPGTCYSVTMTARDGSPITALFKLK